LISGWLVDRFDVKYVFAAGFFLWSSATAATGLLHGFAALVAIRVLLGMGESVAYPSYSKIIASHLPEHRRGVANAMIASGLALGPAFGLLFGATLISRFGWRPFFIGLGLTSLLWLLPWLTVAPRTPLQHSTKHQQEFLAILKQRSMWGTCLALFCGNYFLYFILTWLPFYLVRERGLSLTQMARIAGGLFIFSAASSLFSGWISDRWIASSASHTLVRKSMLVGSALLTGFFMSGAAVTPLPLCVACLLLAGFSFGIGAANLWVVTQRLAGREAVGRWCGVQLFVGNLAGVLAPALTGYFADRTAHFVWPFLVTAAIAWVGAVGWLFVVGPIEPVVWQANQPLASDLDLAESHLSA
jgi:MFS family permease